MPTNGNLFEIDEDGHMIRINHAHLMTENSGHVNQDIDGNSQDRFSMIMSKYNEKFRTDRKTIEGEEEGSPENRLPQLHLRTMGDSIKGNLSYIEGQEQYQMGSVAQSPVQEQRINRRKGYHNSKFDALTNMNGQRLPRRIQTLELPSIFSHN